MIATVRKARPKIGRTSSKSRPSVRRRGNDVSNGDRLLATVEGESDYGGRVRGANGKRWKVM